MLLKDIDDVRGVFASKWMFREDTGGRTAVPEILVVGVEAVGAKTVPDVGDGERESDVVAIVISGKDVVLAIDGTNGATTISFDIALLSLNDSILEMDVMEPSELCLDVDIEESVESCLQVTCSSKLSHFALDLHLQL
jgi:hypothetical protein